MAEEPHLATSEAVAMRNMEGFVPNSGVHSSPRLRPVLYPVTDAGNPNMGWYAHHAMPVSSGGIVENPNIVYQVGDDPNYVNRVGGNPTENPNVAHRVGRGIGENPNFVNQVGGGISQNLTFVNRVGGGIGGNPTFDGRGNVGDQASDEGVDDQSPAKKVKFLCSFGGKILRRPTDGVLRYVGGQTRIISVTRDISFQELWHKMIDVYGKPVAIKYQLPDGELDALVSVSCTEDLENMMDEYAKLVESSSDGSAKLRVFLFSASEVDLSAIGQFSDMLDSGQKYIDAVNGIPDGAGITRKVSIESATSTQYSDGTIGGSEGADCSSHGQGDGGGLPSPSMVSPRVSAVASHDPQTSVVYVAPSPVGYAPPMPMGPQTVLTSLPQTLSSFQPEPEFKRPVPAMVHPQVPLGYDLQKPFGMDFRPSSTYMQAYVDPHQQLSSQVGYPNPHGVGIPGPIYRYAQAPPQLRDNVGFAHQQFIPSVPMSVPSLDPHVGMNTSFVQQVMQPPHTQVDPYLGENIFKGTVVQFPVEQNCPVYHQPQSPPYSPTAPLQAGGGCGLIAPPQHVLSDGRVTHQPRILPEKPPNLEDCLMCQKELPHAHSDTVVQDHRNCISSTISDPTMVYHSAHLEHNLGSRPLNRVVVSGAQGEAEYHESRNQARVFSHIDHLASELSRPGFSQDFEVQPDKDRRLQKNDTPDNPGMLFSWGEFGNAVDVKSQYGLILDDTPQSHQEDALQQSSVPHSYQVKQEPLVNVSIGSTFPPVDTTHAQNLKPAVPESSSKNSGVVIKEDTSTSTYDHLRPIDGRVEGSDTSPREVFWGNEQCSLPVHKFKIEDVPVSRPQIPGQEMFPFNDLDKPRVISDKNHIMPIGTLPSSSEVVHIDSSHPVESIKITKPVMLGFSDAFSHLNMGTQAMASEELLHGKPALSGVDSYYATYNTLLVGERKEDAVICPSGSSSRNTLSPYGGMFGDNWERSPSNSFFSNQDPWTLRHDPHVLPPETHERTANEESFITREEELLHKPSGDLNKDSNSKHSRSNEDIAEEYIKHELKAVAEEVLHKRPGHLNKDPNSEHNRSNEDMADEYIRQELKSVAEGVAAMVLESSIPSESFVPGMNESSPEASHHRVPASGIEAQLTTKTKDVKTELQDKENIRLPLSESIGHLQIIKHSDLEELRELGSGTFGTVYHGKWRGSDVAIKRFNDRCFSGKPSEQSRMIDDFWNEAIKLADLHHPNVVAFYGVVLDGPGDSVATVTEFMVNGSLRQALQRTLDKRKRLLIAMDVAFGMEYLHGKNIVHFDIKSDNLLVNLRDPHRPICKVGDLGLSKMKCHTLISGGVRGTLPWMAPELLNGRSSLVSEKVDVFSFGIVMWELLTGEEPYADLHYGIIIGGIVSNTLRPPVPEYCDLEWRSLMERCWSSDPSERPSFKEIADQLRSMAASLPPKGQTQ